jgi:hypothetical protein
MKHLRMFGKFWYDFIVGDDWRDAAGAPIAIGLTFLAAHHGANLWWLLPVTVTALLTISVRRARAEGGPGSTPVG